MNIFYTHSITLLLNYYKIYFFSLLTDWVDCADEDEANEFREELGADKCDVSVTSDGQWKVRLRRGAVVSIPKALQFDRTVAGQIPTGWSPKTLGT